MEKVFDENQNNVISDENLEQVSGGVYKKILCEKCGNPIYTISRWKYSCPICGFSKVTDKNHDNK